VPLFQLHAGADGFELFDRSAGLVHFAPVGEGDHTKRRALAFAFANHLQVTQLENLQRQQAARQHRRAQRKQGQVRGRDSG